MNIIRQNLFLVIIGAIVVVVGTIELVMYAGGSSAIEETYIAPRQQLDTEIASLGGGMPSPQYSDDLNKRIKDLNEILQKVTANSQGFNNDLSDPARAKYPVMRLQGGVAAFPVNKQYEQSSLIFNFVETYNKQIKAMIASVNAATLADPNYVAEWTKDHGTRLQEQFQREKDALDKERAEGTTESRGNERRDLPTIGTFDPRGVMNVGGDAGQQAARDAEVFFKLQNAKSGTLYMDPNALDRCLPDTRSARSQYEPQQLWEAQINLWLQQDIIGAINQTNDQVRKARKLDTLTVADAAVRRIKSIDVTETYYTLAGAKSGTPAGGPAPVQRYAPPSGPPMMGPPMAGGPQMPWMRGGMTPQRGSTGPDAETLTGHVTDKDFDVVRYTFTVVMPTRYVLALERNLLNRNFHTILKVQMAQVDPVQTGNTGGGNTPQIPYYYGPDAVAEVTIDGELLMMTRWSRGTYEPMKRTWTQPPLVPWQVLRAVQQADAAALRPEDLERLPKTGATGGMPYGR